MTLHAFDDDQYREIMRSNGTWEELIVARKQGDPWAWRATTPLSTRIFMRYTVADVPTLTAQSLPSWYIYID